MAATLWIFVKTVRNLRLVVKKRFFEIFEKKAYTNFHKIHYFFVERVAQKDFDIDHRLRFFMRKSGGGQSSVTTKSIIDSGVNNN